MDELRALAFLGHIGSLSVRDMKLVDFGSPV